MTNLSLKEIFNIIKEEYKPFLTFDKIEFIDNLDYDNFFKYRDDIVLPYLSISGDSYYLKKESLQLEQLFFMALSLLCGNLNPLKVELILLEVKKNISKYLGETTNFYQELEIANVVKDGLLKDVPFNVIFLESDIEIFNYLVSEKGYKIAKLYVETSYEMQKKVLNQGEFNPFKYLEIANDLNFDDICDRLYNFINTRVI